MAEFTKEDFAKFLTFMKQHQAEQQMTSTTTESEITTESPETQMKATPIETGQDNDNDLELKEQFMIAERCRSLASQSKYYEAISLFEKFESIDDADFGMQLLMAECYIQLGRENKAEKAIKIIEKYLTKPPVCDVDDVIALSESFIGNSNSVRALILLRIASDMFQKSSLSPDDKVGGLFRCIKKMIDPVLEMLDQSEGKSSEGISGKLQELLKALTSGDNPDLGSLQAETFGQTKQPPKKNERIRVIALDYGLDVMEEILEDLRNIKDANLENQAIKQAMCSNFIAKQYSSAGQRAKAINSLQIGLKELEIQFPRRANEHQIYVTILSNIGAELHNCEKYQESEMYKLKCLEAVDYVLDFDDENERRTETVRIRESLKVTRNHMTLA